MNGQDGRKLAGRQSSNHRAGGMGGGEFATAMPLLVDSDLGCVVPRFRGDERPGSAARDRRVAKRAIRGKAEALARLPHGNGNQRFVSQLQTRNTILVIMYEGNLVAQRRGGRLAASPKVILRVPF